MAALSSCGGGSEEDLTAPQIRTEVVRVAAAEREPSVPLPDGPPPRRLEVDDLRDGFGAAARKGDRLTTSFVALRFDGSRFESTWDPGSRPFSFRLGADESSPGWERGLVGMRVGGKRELVVPPALISRFGTPAGSGPEDTLVYVIELTGLQRPGAKGRGEPSEVAPEGPPPQRLRVRDLIVGEGAEAERGDLLTVEYVGVRWDGSPFTNSWERPQPFSFRLGEQSVWINPGWQRGLQGMRVGGRRALAIPPDLQYEGGAPPGAKPADSLYYVIDLVSIERGSSTAAISKAAFVEKADRICAQAQRRIAAAAFAIVREQPKPEERLRTELAMLAELVIPALESEVAQIRELGAPAGDEDEVEAILAATEAVVAEAEAEPETFVQAGGEYVAGAVHFREANELARAYGLKVCPAG